MKRRPAAATIGRLMPETLLEQLTSHSCRA